MNIRTLATAVILPIFVGIVLLNVEYSFFGVSKENSTVKNMQKENLAKQAAQLIKHIEDPIQPLKIKKPSIAEFIEKDVADLEALYLAASKITADMKRNDEYGRIISLALEKNKPAFASKIAPAVSSDQIRDQQFIKIIDFALSHNRISHALVSAEKLTRDRIRDEQYQKIIDFGLMQGKKHSNKNLLTKNTAVYLKN